MTDSRLVRRGRVWSFGNDISTDLIMPGAILWNHVKGADARKAAILPNRPGWAANEVQPGDLIVAGTNFGCGSSRAAPRVLRDELQVSCVVAESFSRLFQRNAVNIGFPVLICPGIRGFAPERDDLEVDFDSGRCTNHTRGTELDGEPYPPDSPPGQLLRMGGLRPFLEQWLEDHPEARLSRLIDRSRRNP